MQTTLAVASDSEGGWLSRSGRLKYLNDILNHLDLRDGSVLVVVTFFDCCPVASGAPATRGVEECVSVSAGSRGADSLLLVDSMLGVLVIVWMTGVPLTIPFLLETTPVDSSPGGGVEFEGGPGCAPVAILVAVAITILFYRLDRRGVRSATREPQLASHVAG
ncbi:hypothetical protein [Frondihabitans sucicola]|uniref:hypothetical protein n=1 Tax=Frondihabitans sucicola TaxID=1268041 RepID=UPI00257305A8|nr:hypothetical protein [Frondihabitans sucicola]